MEPYVRSSRGRKPDKDKSKRQLRRIKSQFRQSVLNNDRSASEPMAVDSPNEGDQTCNTPASISGSTVDSSIVTVGMAFPHEFLSSSARPVEPVPDSVQFPHIAENVTTCDDYDSDLGSSSVESILSDSGDSDTPITNESANATEGANTFRETLASCFVEIGLSHQAGDRLLGILRSHECFGSLPKTTKTLLSTPRQPVTLLDVPPGKYLHLGFQVAITRILDSVPSTSVPSTLEVDISTDGATLDNSGTAQIWPLQCRVSNIKGSPTEVIGVYRGQGKPTSAMDFLRPFVDEANQLIRDGGAIYRGSKVPITLRAFIADAPARAFVLNHKGHNSSSPCSKCKVSGNHENRRMTLPGIDHPPRTDEEYLNTVDEDHHKEGESPLSLLPISLVSQVPFEYMHLVCIGVMKRLLLAWVDGKFSIESKLTAHQINSISARLDHLSEQCPQEFARRPRGLNYYHRYKATEFRQLLLYTGPVVLKGLISDENYAHFLLLHACMRILTSVAPRAEELHFARLALKKFVLRCETLYGIEFVSYNVHGLLHLVDDVQLLGPLDAFSAFPYENNMTIFRKYCRKPHLQLEQIANRRAEQSQYLDKHDRSRKLFETPTALDKHADGPLPAGTSEHGIDQYRRLKCRNFTLSLRARDKCCITNDGTVCIVRNIVVCNNAIHLVVQVFGSVTSFYDVAIASTRVGYYQCSRLDEQLVMIQFADVRTKGYLMSRWIPRQFDDSDRELRAEGEYVVAAMTCEIYY